MEPAPRGSVAYTEISPEVALMLSDLLSKH